MQFSTVISSVFSPRVNRIADEESKGIIVPILFGIVILRYIVFDNWKQFIILVLLYTLVYCLSIWIPGMNQEEKTVVLKIKKRMLHKDR